VAVSPADTMIDGTRLASLILLTACSHGHTLET